MEMPLLISRYNGREWTSSGVGTVIGSFFNNFSVLSVCNKPHSFLPVGNHHEAYITFYTFRFENLCRVINLLK